MNKISSSVEEMHEKQQTSSGGSSTIVAQSDNPNFSVDVDEEDDDSLRSLDENDAEETCSSLDFCLDYAHANASQAPYTMTRQHTLHNRTLLLLSNLGSNRGQPQDPNLRPSSSCPRLGPKFNQSHNRYKYSKLLTRHDQELIHTVDVYDCDTSQNVAQTVSAMKSCKRTVINPYQRLLIMTGWLPFHKGKHYETSGEKMSIFLRLVNYFYIFLLMGLILTSFFHEFLICHWSIGISYPDNLNNSKLSSFGYMCEHWITAYLISDILLIITYLIGLWYFRYSETEDAVGILEKVFHYASLVAGRRQTTKLMIRRLRYWLITGLIWTVFAILLYIIHQSLVSYPNIPPQIDVRNSSYQSYAIAFSTIGTLGYAIITLVTIEIVYIYFMHCEMLIVYIRLLCQRIQLRSIPIRVASGDIQIIQNLIETINKCLGTLISCVLIVYINRLGMKIIMLIRDYHSQSSNKPDTVSNIISVLHILPMILSTIFQAGQVNSEFSKIKKEAASMRIFGYLKYRSEQLDSFLLFTALNRMKLRLFGLPIKTNILIGISIFLILGVIILIETNVLGLAKFI